MIKKIRYVSISLTLTLVMLLSLTPGSYAENASAANGSVVISEKVIRDKILGGWVGQMIGVCWGAPTEFKAQGRMLADGEVPAWNENMINDGFGQDDLYVEVPFLQALTDHGANCSIQVISNYYRDTAFGLCHANSASRDNLRKGIPAPDSGNYLYNDHSDDIDWQIEADFVGHMYPAQVNAAIQKAWDIGHIICYGDGVYGGVYVAAMHSAAFTAKSVAEITEAGRQAIPKGSAFRSIIDDVHANYEAGKTWQETWQIIQNMWGAVDHCIEGNRSVFNIDAKLNSAYVLMGLLYGNGDLEQTMKITMMCGQDSDCNPSTAGAILGNYMGYSAIPDKWKSALKRTGVVYSYTNYDFDQVVEMNINLAKEALKLAGGSISGSIWQIPKQKEVIPPPLEQLPEMMPISIFGTKVSDSHRFIAKPFNAQGVASASWNFGDGQTATGLDVTHSYASNGRYNVVCTLTGTDGTVISKTLSYIVGDNIAKMGKPVASVTPVGGGGNKDINVICDGICPNAGSGLITDQFDTFRLNAEAEDQWIGYTFPEEQEFDLIMFQEGMHFDNGGWFSNAAPLKVQVEIDGAWKDVEYTCNPPYISSNLRADFGAPFDKYYFILNKPSSGTGIRLYGRAGGPSGINSGFISCAEMEVYSFSPSNAIATGSNVTSEGTPSPSPSPSASPSASSSNTKVVVFILALVAVSVVLVIVGRLVIKRRLK